MKIVKYLKLIIIDKAQIEELKKKNEQLLSFMDNLGKLNTEKDVNVVDTHEYEKLKVLCSTKSEEIKTLTEENERHKREVAEYRQKLTSEAESNNKTFKDLSQKIKELKVMNFQIESKILESNNKAVMAAAKEKNEQIFMLEEKLKEMKSVNSKLKKNSLQKEIQLRGDLDKEYQLKQKDLITKYEELENKNVNLVKLIERRDEKILQQQSEIEKVYAKLEQISSKIQNQDIDNNVKKLSKENVDMISLNSKLEYSVKKYQERVKRRDATIEDLKQEKAMLKSQIEELQSQITNFDYPSKQPSSDDSQQKAELMEITKNYEKVKAIMASK